MNRLILSINTTLNNSIGYISNADKFGRPDVWEAADIGWILLVRHVQHDSRHPVREQRRGGD